MFDGGCSEGEKYGGKHAVGCTWPSGCRESGRGLELATNSVTVFSSCARRWFVMERLKLESPRSPKSHSTSARPQALHGCPPVHQSYFIRHRSHAHVVRCDRCFGILSLPAAGELRRSVRSTRRFCVRLYETVEAGEGLVDMYSFWSVSCKKARQRD